MSNHIISMAYKRDLRTAMRKSVMVLLADKASDDGSGIYASKKTMADELCCSKQTVIDTIKQFVDEGLVEELGHRRNANGFTVEYGIVIAALEAVPMVGCHADKGSAKLTGQPAGPVKQTPLTGQPAGPKPLGTIPSEAKASSGKRAAQPRFALPSHIPADAWADFIDMRKRMGKPMTDRAKELAVAKLDRLAADGWPPGDVLNNSTLNSYQGLFPPKELPNGRHQSTVQQTGDGLHRPHSRAVSRYLSLVEQEEAERRDAADHSGTEFQVPPLLENRH